MVTRPTLFFWGVTAVTAAGIWVTHQTQVEEREVGRLRLLHTLSGQALTPGRLGLEQALSPPAATACRRPLLPPALYVTPIFAADHLAAASCCRLCTWG